MYARNPQELLGTARVQGHVRGAQEFLGIPCIHSEKYNVSDRSVHMYKGTNSTRMWRDSELDASG